MYSINANSFLLLVLFLHGKKLAIHFKNWKLRLFSFFVNCRVQQRRKTRKSQEKQLLCVDISIDARIFISFRLSYVWIWSTYSSVPICLHSHSPMRFDHSMWASFVRALTYTCLKSNSVLDDSNGKQKMPDVLPSFVCVRVSESIIVLYSVPHLEMFIDEEVKCLRFIYRMC